MARITTTTLIFYLVKLLSLYCLLTFCLLANVSCSAKMKASKQNLTQITWAHGVNSQQQLNAALQSNVEMLEADIVLGQIAGSGSFLPIMAHPPAMISDISLSSFLQQIADYNKGATKSKGVKLDFKSIEVFEGSLTILNKMIPNMNYPIWLNADILRGPVNQIDIVPVDPERFFSGCSDFPKAVLSIGWTTRWGANYSSGEDTYTTEQINNMLDVIKRNINTYQPITFPVRAGIAANSEKELHRLVKSVNATRDVSLTIWSSQGDFVDITKLRKLILSFGFERVYLDVPEEVATKLDLSQVLSNKSGSIMLAPLVIFNIISLAMFFTSTCLQ